MRNLNEILNISGNIESTEKADHTLKIPELGEFCGYCFRNYTCEKRLTVYVTNKFKVLGRLSSRLANVMFRGTPCSSTQRVHPLKLAPKFPTLTL